MPKYKGVYKKGNLFYAYKNFKGKRYYAGKGFKTAEEAAETRLKLEQELGAGIINKRNLTSFQYIKLFFEKYAVNWTLSRQKSVGIIIRKYIYPFIENKKLRDIDELDVQNMRNAIINQKFSKSYNYEILKIIKLFFNVAVQWGLIIGNPARSLKLKKPPKRPKVRVLPADIVALIDSIEGREKAIIAVGFYAQLRIGEALALKWEDVRFKEGIIIPKQQIRLGEIKKPKTDASKSEILMLDILTFILKEWKLQCPSDTWLFPSPSRRNMPITPNNWRSKYFNPILGKHGVVMRFHDLRHLGGIFLRRCGLDLDYIQEQMRHSSISTTVDIYGNIGKNQLRKKLNDVDEHVKSLLKEHKIKRNNF